MRLDKLPWLAVWHDDGFIDYHMAELMGGEGGEVVIYHDHPEETYDILLLSRTERIVQVHARYDNLDALSAQAVIYELTRGGNDAA